MAAKGENQRLDRELKGGAWLWFLFNIRYIFCALLNSDLSDALEEEAPQEIVHPEDDHSLYSENSFGSVAARKETEVVQSAVGVYKKPLFIRRGSSLMQQGQDTGYQTLKF